jgi:outer membrane translocation and assembly module TamA
MALGGRYWQRDFYGSLDVAGAAFYSWRQYQHYDVQFGLMPHMARRLPDRSWKGDDVYELGDMAPGFTRVPFYVTLRYRYLPQEDYYGSGPDSELEDRTTYLREETSLYLRTGYQFTENIVWMVSGGAPGLTTPPDYLRFGTQVLFDYRDEPANPHSGFMVALALGRFEDQSEDAFSFTSIGIDSRAAIPLGSRQRILALRGVWIIDQADAGNQVPFFMQKSLGGSHTLRGFDSFRFTGEKVMLYQAEYRWEPSDLWALALFVDTGTVSEADSRLSFSNLEWDYGAGIRFKNWRSVLIRMEIAWSRETTRYYFRTSASF